MDIYNKFRMSNRAERIRQNSRVSEAMNGLNKKTSQLLFDLSGRGRDVLKIDKNAATKALELVAGMLARFSLPSKPVLEYYGMIKNATGSDGIVSDGIVRVGAKLTTLMGHKAHIDIPVMIRNKSLVEPAVFFYNGAPVVMCAPALDELVKRGTLTKEIQDRRLFSGPSDVMSGMEEKPRQPVINLQHMYSPGARNPWTFRRYSAHEPYQLDEEEEKAHEKAMALFDKRIKEHEALIERRKTQDPKSVPVVGGESEYSPKEAMSKLNNPWVKQSHMSRVGESYDCDMCDGEGYLDGGWEDDYRRVKCTSCDGKGVQEITSPEPESKSDLPPLKVEKGRYGNKKAERIRRYSSNVNDEELINNMINDVRSKPGFEKHMAIRTTAKHALDMSRDNPIYSLSIGNYDRFPSLKDELAKSIADNSRTYSMFKNSYSEKYPELDDQVSKYAKSDEYYEQHNKIDQYMDEAERNWILRQKQAKDQRKRTNIDTPTEMPELWNGDIPQEELDPAERTKDGLIPVGKKVKLTKDMEYRDRGGGTIIIPSGEEGVVLKDTKGDGMCLYVEFPVMGIRETIHKRFLKSAATTDQVKNEVKQMLREGYQTVDIVAAIKDRYPGEAEEALSGLTKHAAADESLRDFLISIGIIPAAFATAFGGMAIEDYMKNKKQQEEKPPAQEQVMQQENAPSRYSLKWLEEMEGAESLEDMANVMEKYK